MKGKSKSYSVGNRNCLKKSLRCGMIHIENT